METYPAATDADGRYHFGPVPFGDYQVGVGGSIVPVSRTPGAPEGQASGELQVYNAQIAAQEAGRIAWPAVPGMRYVVVECCDVAAGSMDHWEVLGERTETGVVEFFTDPEPAVSSARFYRVRWVAPPCAVHRRGRPKTN